MSNMSHCRFENTLYDLRDCYRAMGDMESPNELSDSEQEARLRLLKLCMRIASEYEDEVSK